MLNCLLDMLHLHSSNSNVWYIRLGQALNLSCALNKSSTPPEELVVLGALIKSYPSSTRSPMISQSLFSLSQVSVKTINN